MRLRERVALWALLMIGLCGCVHSSQEKSEEHLVLHDRETVKADEHKAETISRAPSDIATDSDTKEMGVEVQAPTGEITLARVTAAHPLKLAPGSKILGTVPLAETTRHRDEHQGAVIDTKASDSSKESCEDLGLDLTKKTEKKSETSYWPPWWLFAGGAALLALAGVLIWKFSLPGRVMRFLGG